MGRWVGVSVTWTYLYVVGLHSIIVSLRRHLMTSNYSHHHSISLGILEVMMEISVEVAKVKRLLCPWIHTHTQTNQQAAYELYHVFGKGS